MKQLSAAAVERAMKLQDVMLRAMAKRITWFQAAERDTTFVPLKRKNLDLVFSLQYERVVARDNTVSFASRVSTKGFTHSFVANLWTEFSAHN
jgi:hypothetical protein